MSKPDFGKVAQEIMKGWIWPVEGRRPLHGVVDALESAYRAGQAAGPDWRADRERAIDEVFEGLRAMSPEEFEKAMADARALPCGEAAEATPPISDPSEAERLRSRRDPDLPAPGAGGGQDE